MDSSNNWCTIESDPGVFTELMEKMGAKDVMVDELFDVSDESFEAIAPAFGLLFLFKWTKETAAAAGGKPLAQEETDPNFFFARQTVTNACATQAILSILLNASNRVDIGKDLSEFKEFTKEFTPEMRGETLGSNPMIRTVHNAFARPEPFVMEDSSGSASSKRKGLRDEDDDDAAYHFIAYLPYQGGLYEVDGLQPGPVCLQADAGFGDDVDSSAWMKAVRPYIEARINRYAGGEIRFNLMAVIKDRKPILLQRLEKAEAEGRAQDATAIREHLAAFEEKRKLWMEENIRRKHNYVPFIVTALRLLAKKKKLKGLVRAAQEKALERKRARDQS